MLEFCLFIILAALFISVLNSQSTHQPISTDGQTFGSFKSYQSKSLTQMEDEASNGVESS
jgi:hypothetical protein